jgi:Peptidase_C39 like family/Papain-like cysteine protease AvrRpt2
MKKYIFGIIIIFSIHSYSQDRILNVPLISQQTKNWCWAASMEMVIKYHQPSRQFPTDIGNVPISQKYLAFFNYNNRQRFIPKSSLTSMPLPESWSSVAPLVFDCNSSSSASGTSPTDKLNIQIPTFGQKNDNQAFDVLFSQLGYSSTQIRENMWLRVINEISKCRPVIILLGNPSDNITTSSHAVVATGYITSLSRKYLTICNPKKDASPECEGEYLLISEEYFTNNVNSIVNFIVPTGQECTNVCSSKPPVLSSTTVFQEFQSLKQKIVANDTANSTDVIIRTVSTEMLKNPLNKTTESILNKSERKLKQTKDASFFYDLIKDAFLLTEVRKKEAFKLEPKVSINNQEIQLSNKSGSKNPYDIILFPNSDYIFYRYQENNQTLLIPYRFYEIDGKKFEPNQSYPDSSIISKLKEIN